MSHIAEKGIVNPIAQNVIFTWFVGVLSIVSIENNKSGSHSTFLFKISLDNSMKQPDLLRKCFKLISVQSSESIIIASDLESFLKELAIKAC